MNFDLLDKAKARINSIPVLVNMCSMRVRQLNQGMRPLLKPEPGEDTIDTVLREIAEGKLVSQVDYDVLERRGLGHR